MQQALLPRKVSEICWNNNNNVKYFSSTLLYFLILGFSRVPKHLSRPPPPLFLSSPSQIFGGLTPPSVLSYLTLCPVHSEGDKNMDVFHFQSARLLSVSFSRFLGFFFSWKVEATLSFPAVRRPLRRSRCWLPFLYMPFSSDKHCIYFFILCMTFNFPSTM